MSAVALRIRNPANFAFYKQMQKHFVELLSEHDELPLSYEYKAKVYPIDRPSWPAYRDATEEYGLMDDGSASNLLLWHGANEFMFSHRHTDDVRAGMLAETERRDFA